MGAKFEVSSEVAGNVWKVLAKEGQRVSEAEPLVIVESMKMEIPIESPTAGIVRQILCAEGQNVAEGVLIAVVDSDS